MSASSGLSLLPRQMDAIHTATTDALAALLARQPHSQAKLEFAWQAVVGPAAHRATVAVRLDETVLHVDVRDATWAHELGQAVATLIPRLNQPARHHGR